MQCVFAFDRDDCVSVSPKTGPIPTEWVRYLAYETDHEVWATGNQKLTDEADIPGTDEMVDLFLERWGPPEELVRYRTNPKLEVTDGIPDDGPAPDLVTAVVGHVQCDTGIDYVDNLGGPLNRQQRVRLLGTLFPDADLHIVIDNRYLGYLEDWIHLFPQQFVDLAETFMDLEALGPPVAVDLPPYYSWRDEWKALRHANGPITDQEDD